MDKVVTIRIDSSLWEEFKHFAVSTGSNASVEIRKFIESYLQDQKSYKVQDIKFEILDKWRDLFVKSCTHQLTLDELNFMQELEKLIIKYEIK